MDVSVIFRILWGFATNLVPTQNASKNAGDMINKFQILFNRTRQAVITGELVEIITGAAASAEG